MPTRTGWNRTIHWWCLGLLSVATSVAPACLVAQEDFERAPINYETAPENNVISRLGSQLENGTVALTWDEQFGYLPSLLQALRVPQSSQMLVYSKTSFQRERINPRTPRAIYYNDEVYVGYCHRGEVLEISAVDPQLGAVFYAMRQDKLNARFSRQNDSCLVCHGSTHTQNVPGHIVRSVHTNAAGFPVLSSGTYRIDQTSPMARRWGGWYVTGTHGDQKHLGNLIVNESRLRDEVDNSAGHNVTDLSSRFNTKNYLQPTSDMIALMVMEHQAQAQNLITRANFLTRRALYDERELNRELNRGDDYRAESTISRIKNAGEPLVKYLLCSGEAALTAPIRGVSKFAEEFAARGPFDSHGRSLRQLNLETRLFENRCSYLVYTDEFQQLPTEVLEYIGTRFDEILAGQDRSSDFAHLTPEERVRIREILTATLPEGPLATRIQLTQSGN